MFPVFGYKTLLVAVSGRMQHCLKYRKGIVRTLFWKDNHTAINNMKANHPATASTTEAFYQKLGQLHVWSGERWLTLPRWAAFYLELGVQLGTLPLSSNNVVVALVVPTRAYVAAFIAAGIVLVRAAHPEASNSAEQHVKQLKELAPGTPVYLRQEKRREGVFQGVATGFGKTYFKIQVDSSRNKTIDSIPEEKAHQIEIRTVESVKLPKNQNGRERREIAPLVLGLLDGHSMRFVSESCSDCVVIGNLTALKQECEEQRLALRTTGSQNSQFLKGALLDIVRPRRFLPATAAHRSYILPASSSQRLSQMASSYNPHCTIFDGSYSYLKLHHAWRQSHSVIILDRTDARFDEATLQVNTAYLDREENQHSFSVPTVPAGVEIMHFEVSQ